MSQELVKFFPLNFYWSETRLTKQEFLCLIIVSSNSLKINTFHPCHT